MGPRSYERGNLCRVITVLLRIAELQWGRVLMNAEIPQLCRPAPAGQCFNGAAFL